MPHWQGLALPGPERRPGTVARVLIVEDDSDVRDFLAEVLTTGGYEVSTAPNGDQGINLLKSLAPDLLLTDILMPGKGGFGLLQELQSVHHPPKIIAMSGAPAQWIVLGLAKKLGARRTLSKPFTPSDLLGAVGAVLAEP
jgi:DNA-binding response OmpR family regulator